MLTRRYQDKADINIQSKNAAKLALSSTALRVGERVDHKMLLSEVAMYGMVNNAIRSFVIERHGLSVWHAVCAAARVDDTEFAAVLPYDDALTLTLIAETAVATDESVDATLRAVGSYWVQFTARSSFGKLFRFGGADLEQFLRNLDAMHSKIKASLPQMAPPSFKVQTQDDGTLLVHYTSSRSGLFPFVEGLFSGLSELFGQAVNIIAFQALGPGEAEWQLQVAAPLGHCGPSRHMCNA